MPYKIRIAVSKKGVVAIGSRGVKSLNSIASSEYVYGSQLGHRVAGQTKSGKWVITTPTDAKKKGLKHIKKAW